MRRSCSAIKTGVISTCFHARTAEKFERKGTEKFAEIRVLPFLTHEDIPRAGETASFNNPKILVYKKLKPDIIT